MSVASFSTYSSLSSATSLWITGNGNSTAGRLVAQLQSFFFVIVTKTSSYPKLALLLLILEYFQWYSFNFINHLETLGIVDSSGLRYLEFLRTAGSGYLPETVHILVLFGILTYIAFIASLFVWLYWKLHNGLFEHAASLKKEGGLYLEISQHLVDTIFIFYLPLSSYLMDTLFCNYNQDITHEIDVTTSPADCWKGVHIFYSVMAIFGYLLLFVITGLCSLMAFEWMPSKQSYSSVVNSRIRLVMFFGKTVLFFMDLGMDFASGSSIAVGVIFLICNLYILYWVASRLPYHRWQTNLAIIVFMSWTTVEGFLRMVLAEGQAPPLASGLTILLFVLFICVLSFFLARRRIIRLYKFNTSNGAEVVEANFSKEFEVEVAARVGYYTDAEELIEDSVNYFLQGADQFPQSSEVRVWYAVLLLVHSDDVHLLSVAILRAQKMRLTLDTAFVLACLERHRKNILFDKDGGVQEISESLKKASRYQEECLQYIRSFWAHLMKEQELGSLTDLVASIESTEKKAETIFQNLILRFPKSPQVLRAYGQFLEDIKNDLELSHSAFMMAEELEEELSHKHKHKHKKNASFLKKKVVVEEEPEPAPVEDMEPVYDNYMDQDEPQEITKPQEETIPFGLVGKNDKPREMPDLRMKRRNTATQKRYRINIEKRRSSALTCLRVSIAVTIAVILIDIACMFGSLAIISSGYKYQLQELTTTASASFHVQGLPWNARLLEIILRDKSSIEEIQQSLKTTAERVSTTLQKVEDLSFHDKAIMKTWSKPIHQRIDFQPVTGERIFSNDSLRSISNRLMSEVWALAESEFSQEENVTQRVDWRFIMDNSPRSINYGFFVLEAEVLQKTLRDSATSKDVFVIVFAVSAGVLVLTLFSFWFATSGIKKERLGILKLFLAIPKGTIQTIHEQLSKKDDDTLKDFEETEESFDAIAVDVDSVSQGMPVLRKLTYRYIFVVVFLFGLVCCLFAIGLVLIGRTTATAPEVRAMQEGRSLASRITVLSQELYIKDYQTWEKGLIEIQDYLDEANNWLSSLYNGLIFGNDKFHLQGLQDGYTRFILEEIPCTLPKNATCKGLNRIFEVFSKYQEQIKSLPEENYYMIEEWIPDIEALQNEFTRLIDMLTENHKKEISHKVSLSKSLGTAFLVLSLPCFCIGFFVLHPLQTKMHQENERTIKMLLMIPIDVIENVKVIKEYLTPGEKASSDHKIKDALEESFGRMKSIVEGSIDAIIVVDANGIIEIWNPAAEKLFGYKSEEVIGKNVKMIIPDHQQKAHEAGMKRYLATRQSVILGRTVEYQAKSKDGTLMPIQLEINEGKVGQRTIFCAFLKDITEITNSRKELQKEKDKSERLLYSFLPKQIANQLKEERDEQDRSLIAESYKEVTVLFADIVGFTKMSSRIGASELIHLLNTLFSQWDILCERHKVEKIKTIGDCYMAASGVPERSIDHANNMMEFAIDLIDSLKQFNEETSNSLKLRIGINSGSVVAGVIGARKYAFDLWGDAVNVASRMESTGVPNRIQVSQSTFEILKQDYLFEERGRVEVKGKGTMLTYLFKERMLQRTDSGKLKRRAAITPPSVSALKGLITNDSKMFEQQAQMIQPQPMHPTSNPSSSGSQSPKEESELSDEESSMDEIIEEVQNEDSEVLHPNEVPITPKSHEAQPQPTKAKTPAKKATAPPARTTAVKTQPGKKSKVKFDN